MIHFRLATEADAAHVGENLRPVDRIEIERGSGGDPFTQTVRSHKASVIAWAMILDGEPIAVFGVAPHPGAESVGIVWLLGTPKLDRQARALLEGGRKYVGLMSRLYPKLINLIDAQNARTRRWLKRLGFVERAPYLTATGHEFILIEYPNV